MSHFLLRTIDPAELRPARTEGVDPHGSPVEAFTDSCGGAQLRCCLHRSHQGERLMLVAHAPLATRSPWREVGPVFVHADECPGRADSAAVPTWLDEGARVLRAYTPGGTMHYPANRIVRVGEGVAVALAEMFDDPLVAEVHVRNLLEQCFIVRAVRTR